MTTAWELSAYEQQDWLDEGNTFALPFSRSRYVARKLEDGAYVCYHYDYSTFGRAYQYAARYGEHYTLYERGVSGPALFSLSPKDIKEHLDRGEVFSMPLENNQGFAIRRLSDGCYIQYSPERSTFASLQAEMARNGPAWLWQQAGPEGELPTHSE